VLILLLVVASGCKQEESTSAGGGTGGSGAPAPAEVRLGYFGNVTHAQAVLGVASGEFEQAVAPAKFSTKVFNAGPSLIEALFANQIDIGYVGPGPVISAHQKSRGQGIRVIAGAASNGVLIVARKDSGIGKLEDLKGKKVATPQHGNTQDVSARHYLSSVLKQPDTNNVIPVANAEQAAMMARGQIDAAWAPEPWGSRLIIENGAKLIAEEKDLWPNKQFVLTVVVTTPEFLAKYPDTVRKVLGVHAKWTQRLQDEPDRQVPQLADALLKLSGKKLPDGVLQQSIRNVQFTLDPLNDTFVTMSQWASDLGFAKQVELKGLVDTSIIQELSGTTMSSAGAATTQPATAATTQPQ
jgi:NitT/TauT family transport system substrate-binding protein